MASTKTMWRAGALLASVLTTACAGQAKTPEPAAAPPSVPVVAAQQRPVPLETTYTGRVEPIHRVELRPRVGGALDAVLFREGALVPTGAPLFRIDQRPYQIALRRAQAEVATVAARLAHAQHDRDRAEQLAKADAIALEELDRRRSEVETLAAQLQAAEAIATDAALQLDFTVVRAPVAGRIGRAEVTVGNLVAGGATGGTRLALLQSLDPIHVYFELDAATAARARRTDRRDWRASVAPLEGSQPEISGPVDFVDSGVGAQTGTLKVRARLANPGGHLMPSAVVRVTFRYGTQAAATLVPERAIGTEQGLRYVLIAGEDGVVEYRPVILGATVGDWRIVADGSVRAGERIVLPGMPGLRAGLRITPVEEVVR